MKVTLFLVILAFACFQNVLSQDDAAINPQIYGGIYASDGQFPFMVHLWDIAQQYYFCGGSLIGPYHVLTAAHCTEGSRASNMAVGDSNILTYSADVNLVLVATIFQHPSYNPNTIKNDLTVLKLKTPFPASSHMRTIKPATVKIQSGVTTTVAGWGGTEYYYYTFALLYTTAPVISTASCRNYNGYGDVSSTSQICVFKKDHDSCQGDSGGPLFTGSKAVAVQHGIVSYGIGCGIKPGVYTSVFYYRNWIVSKTAHAVTTTASKTNTIWKSMCQSIQGTYKYASGQMQCLNLNIEKTRAISFAWNDCGLDRVVDFCLKVGRYSCSNNRGHCNPL
jgi:trypsin